MRFEWSTVHHIMEYLEKQGRHMGFMQRAARFSAAARACLKSIRHYLRYMNRYSSFFMSAKDVEAFRLLLREYCRFPKPEPLPVPLHIRSMEGLPLMCRTGTTDWIVLWDTFHDQYHLPPGGLPSPACIVDLGANAGYTMAHFAQLYPEARIVGVEMDEANAAMASRNIQPFGDRCRILHAAIWSDDRRIEYGGEKEFGFQVAEYLSRDGTRRFVEAVSMATLMQRYEIDHIDYLKVDVEGAEAELFRREPDWLARVNALKVEIHPPATFASIAGTLSSFGFKCDADAKHWDCVVAVREES